MTPLRRHGRTLWTRFAGLYEQIVWAAAVHHLILTDDAWAQWYDALLDVLYWADLLAASSLRYRALRQRTNVPNPDHLDPRHLADMNPWLAEHQAESHPLIEQRARWVLEAEQRYAARRQAATLIKIRGGQEYAPQWRLERMKRDEIGEVQATAEQIQLTNPEVSYAFTHAAYFTRDDSRVRPTHARMHGFVAWRGWKHWPIIRPLNGWNCRCFTRLIARHEAIDNGWLTEGGRVLLHVRWPNSAAEDNFNKGRFPDPGWNHPKYWAWPQARQGKRVA